jgi:hypothetical protein
MYTYVMQPMKDRMASTVSHAVPKLVANSRMAIRRMIAETAIDCRSSNARIFAARVSAHTRTSKQVDKDNTLKRKRQRFIQQGTVSEGHN